MIDLGALVDNPTLVGDRIRMVPITPEHAEGLHRVLTDPEVDRLTGTHATFTVDQIRAHAEKVAARTDRLDLVIEDKGTGAVLGDIAMLDLDPPNESAAMRIALGPDSQGKGIGPEAIRLLLAYVFNVVGLHRLQLDVFDFNERGIRAYEKCGFRHEGRLRDALLWNGERHDSLIMSVLRPEWLANVDQPSGDPTPGE